MSKYFFIVHEKAPRKLSVFTIEQHKPFQPQARPRGKAYTPPHSPCLPLRHPKGETKTAASFATSRAESDPQELRGLFKIRISSGNEFGETIPGETVQERETDP